MQRRSCRSLCKRSIPSASWYAHAGLSSQDSYQSFLLQGMVDRQKRVSLHCLQVSLETTPLGRLGAVIHKAFRSAGRDWVYFLSILGQTQRCISRLCIWPSDQGPSVRLLVCG